MRFRYAHTCAATYTPHVPKESNENAQAHTTRIHCVSHMHGTHCHRQAQTTKRKRTIHFNTHTCVPFETRVQWERYEYEWSVCPISIENRGRCSEMYDSEKGNTENKKMPCRMEKARESECDRHKHVRNGNCIGISYAIVRFSRSILVMCCVLLFALINMIPHVSKWDTLIPPD